MASDGMQILEQSLTRLNWSGLCQKRKKGIQEIATDEKMQLISPELYNFSDDQRPHTALALREVVRGTSTGCAPAALRVHDHVSLHFSTTDNGPRAAACLFEDESAAHG